MKKTPLQRLFFLALIVITGAGCFQQRELERYQSLARIDTLDTRLAATLAFIHDYPESDSLRPAIQSALALMNTRWNADQTLLFILNQRFASRTPDIRHYLDSLLVTRLSADSATVEILYTRITENKQKYADRTAFALALFPQLNDCFESDSIRRKQIIRFSDIILQAEFADVTTLQSLSDQVLSLNDSLLIPVSNRFLITAIGHNLPHPAVSDSLHKARSYALFVDLAWNAYRQGRYTYALNLISQASKYGHLEKKNGFIILGAAQAENGELNDAWAHLLQGLILNPEAEQNSEEIKEIYQKMFYQIRGRREDPNRFLRQYRRLH